MWEGAEESVGEEAGNLNLRQRDGCTLSLLKQRDGLSTQKHISQNVDKSSYQAANVQGFKSRFVSVQFVGEKTKQLIAISAVHDY